ncbi:MAG: hypothetical protein U9Q19_05435 [Pseudomonadota bacterium]|nr:hypothetical protein [Pseudomonadota bacterium]
MSKVTKAEVDTLATLEIEVRAKKKAFQAIEKKYKLALGPILEYLDTTLKIAPDKAAEIRGKQYVMLFGAKRQQRYLKDTVEALRRLEAVRQGLGYENISIALGVLDEQLRADEVTDIIGQTYGSRSVKSTFIGEEDKA